jgi:hypothetical protein
MRKRKLKKQGKVCGDAPWRVETAQGSAHAKEHHHDHGADAHDERRVAYDAINYRNTKGTPDRT